jgi:hypothetical protein
MGTPLDLEAIGALLASSKTRGDYREYLISFINGSDVGEEVDLGAGNLAGKDAKNVAQGFNGARKKMLEDGTPSVPGGKDVKVLLKWETTDEDLLDAAGNPVKDKDGKTEKVRIGHVFLINTAKYTGDTSAMGEEVTDEEPVTA